MEWAWHRLKLGGETTVPTPMNGSKFKPQSQVSNIYIVVTTIRVRK